MSRALGLVTFSCGHAIPQAGSDRTSRIACGSCRYIDVALGPQKVGGVYHCGYWGQDYTVLHIARDAHYIGGWEITIRWADGRISRHSTAWEPKRDRVISEPTTARDYIERLVGPIPE